MPRRRRREPDPDHTVDLHRMGVDLAQRHLSRELAACRAGGLERVLIITGRGWGSLDREPVLRPAIETFLRSREGRELGVTDVKSASKGGAFLVRISRD